MLHSPKYFLKWDIKLQMQENQVFSITLQERLTKSEVVDEGMRGQHKNCLSLFEACQWVHSVPTDILQGYRV